MYINQMYMMVSAADRTDDIAVTTGPPRLVAFVNKSPLDCLAFSRDVKEIEPGYSMLAKYI